MYFRFPQVRSEMHGILGDACVTGAEDHLMRGQVATKRCLNFKMTVSILLWVLLLTLSSSFIVIFNVVKCNLT